MPRRPRRPPIDPKTIHPLLTIGGVYRFTYGIRRIRTARLEAITLAGELVVRIYHGAIWRDETIRIKPHQVEPTTPASPPPTVDQLFQIAEAYRSSEGLSCDNTRNRYTSLLQSARRFQSALALQNQVSRSTTPQQASTIRGITP